MINFERLDLFISKTENISRENAKDFILSGNVFVDGKKIIKPSFKVNEEFNIEIQTQIKYVGRGGYKLEKALNHFDIDVANKICMDVGASTGGFSDCLLQNLAGKIYAVDVGHSQLSEKISSNPKVISLEKTNIKNISLEQIEALDFVCVDVSFISLTKILDNIFVLMKDKAEIVCLVKPQFEAGKANLNKSGIVKVPKVHIKVLENILEHSSSLGFCNKGLTFSGIKGTEGNIEYLLYMSKIKNDDNKIINVKTVVAEAFDKLK